MIQQLQDAEIESMIKVYESGVNILMPYTLTELFIKKRTQGNGKQQNTWLGCRAVHRKLISIT